MKSMMNAVAALLLVASPSLGGDRAKAGDDVILGASPAPAPDESCVEVEIGGDKAPGLSCLNQQLRRAVDGVRPPANIPPLDAASPAVRVGGFNEAAMQEQFGKNFGKSVIPFRPPPPVFASPLSPRR